MINVISQSTSERNNETRELFNECKIYLDDGYSLSHAVRIVKNIQNGFQARRWFKDLKEYAELQGYKTRM